MAGYGGLTGWVEEDNPQVAAQAAAEAAALRQRAAVGRPFGLNGPGGRQEGAATRGLDALGTGIYEMGARPSRIWGALNALPPGEMLSDHPEIVDSAVATATDLMGAGTGTAFSLAPKGSVGIFGGRLAKTADHAKLAQAEEMLAKGAFPDEVHAATGWFQGADKKWRFEIPDDAAALKRPIEMGYSNPALGKTVEHDLAYAAYPDLKKINLGRVEGKGGDYRADAPWVGESIRIGEKEANQRGVVLHEMQHAIQKREGFAEGGSPQEFTRGYSSQLRDLEEQVSTINGRLKAAAGTPRYNELMDMRQELVNEIQKIQGPHGIGASEKGFDEYRRLAGEVEARNVQHRADWPADKRADIPPSFSQDVPDKDQIVRFGSLAPQASAPAKPQSEFGAYIAENGRLTNDFHKELERTFADRGRFAVETDYGRTKVLTKNTYPGGAPYRITTFDGKEPTGHFEVSTLREAAKELRSHTKYKSPSPEEFGKTWKPGG